MRNIDISSGTTIRQDKTPDQYIRFSANFDSDVEQLAFHMELLQCIGKFQVEVAKESKK